MGRLPPHPQVQLPVCSCICLLPPANTKGWQVRGEVCVCDRGVGEGWILRTRPGLNTHYTCAWSCPTLCSPRNCSHQAPLSVGFSRQEHWSGLPFTKTKISDKQRGLVFTSFPSLSLDSLMSLQKYLRSETKPRWGYFSWPAFIWLTTCFSLC